MTSKNIKIWSLITHHAFLPHSSVYLSRYVSSSFPVIITRKPFICNTTESVYTVLLRNPFWIAINWHLVQLFIKNALNLDLLTGKRSHILVPYEHSPYRFSTFPWFFTPISRYSFSPRQKINGNLRRSSAPFSHLNWLYFQPKDYVSLSSSRIS